VLGKSFKSVQVSFMKDNYQGKRKNNTQYSLFSTEVLTTFCHSCLGSVEALLSNLSSPNEEVRSSAAVALGYLSFDRTAARLMLQACRNTPGLLESLVSNLGNGKISMEFMDEWRQTKMVGLPSAR